MQVTKTDAVTKEVIKVVVEKEEEYTIVLNREEALVLFAICSNISGLNKPIRSVTDNVYQSMRNVGFQISDVCDLSLEGLRLQNSLR